MPSHARRERRTFEQDGLLRDSRPAFVISPTAADLQVAGRVPFQSETARFDERDGRGIPGLDIGLEPVQPQGPECEPHDGPQAGAHESLALVAGEHVVAQVGAAKGAANDVRDVEDASGFNITNNLGRTV